MPEVPVASDAKSPKPLKKVALYKGSKNVADLNANGDPLGIVRKDVADVINSKNLAFLIGSGASSSRGAEGQELGIPTMQPMAAGFLSATNGAHFVSVEDRAALKSKLGLDLDDDAYTSNIEALMEVLLGYQFTLGKSSLQISSDTLKVVDRVVGNATGYILEACLNGAFAAGDDTVLRSYEQFYRRIVQRDRALPRPWVFTTNYDLFSETAMDRLGIPYINGFQGSIERRFNPAVFRYALSEQLDIANRKWSSVDSLVYFAKLHGSVAWESRDDGLFPVVETHPKLIDKKHLLIYPTPAKQNASFASPYSDMFREFQTRVARGQSALVTLGYGFGDEHVNNIIFQALTIPTFRLVAFVDPSANDMIKKLRALDDPRIWLIGTEDAKAEWKGHYFANFVEEFLATEGEDASTLAIQRVVDQLINRAGQTPDETNE